MTVDKLLCQSLKDRGKWVATLCHFCRNRKRCKDNPDNKPMDLAKHIFDTAVAMNKVVQMQLK